MSYDNWIYKSRFPQDVVTEILKNRNVENPDKFINPKYEDLVDPSVFKDIDKALERIRSAVASNEKIGIFMDYDADGVTGGAIMHKALSNVGAELEYYVPERTEGYGLNEKAINEFAKKKVGLLITVDCGVKNHKEIAFANGVGMDAIIVDHHQLDEALPEALAIVHPKIVKRGIGLDLSGGGVAFMLSRAILEDHGRAKWLIDLAAISSVADVVPIVDDNRTIVKYGLIVLNKTKNIGLKALYSVAGLNNKSIGVYDIGFVIAPRLNAAGRIAHPKDAFKLLISENTEEAKQLAEKLNHLNQIRQDKLANAIKEAELEVLKSKQDTANAIVLLGQWDEGIIGLVASKICEKYNRPAIILTKVDGFLKGSARSIKSINVTDLIGCAGEHLLSYGGHIQAAGLSLKADKYQTFIKIIKSEAKKFDKKLFVRNLQIDALLHADQLNLKLAEQIEKLQPFGMGNPRPNFAIENVTVRDIKTIGKDSNHLKVTLCSADTANQCLMFDYINKSWFIEAGDKIDVVFSLSINEWNNRRNLDLIVEDVKKK